MGQKAGLKITSYKTAWDSLFRRGGLEENTNLYLNEIQLGCLAVD